MVHCELKQKILVTGASGFIGSALIEQLCTMGHNVIGINRHDRGRQNSSRLDRYVIGSLMDGELLKQILEGVEVCYHLGWSSIPLTAQIDPRSDIIENLIGSINLFQHCTAAGVKRIIFASSGGTIYGQADVLPTPEEHPLRPKSAYGISKVSVEHYLQMYGEQGQFHDTTLRFSNIYGPGQLPNRGQGFIATALYNLIHNLPITLYGEGNAVRDFLYISDAVRALCMAKDYTGAERVFNIGSGEGSSIRSILQHAESLCGKSAMIKNVKLGSHDVSKSILNIDRARRQLQFEPLVPLSEGLSLTKDYLDLALA